MKIFYVSRINVGVEDAGTRHVWEFCRQFARLGHEVTLFIPDMGHKRPLEGVSIIQIPSPVKKSSATFFSFYFILAFFFIYHCLKNRPDVLYTRHQPMEWMTVWLKIIFKLVYVAEVNGRAPVEMKINRMPGWYIAAIRCVEKFCFNFSDLIVTPSPRIIDSLRKDHKLAANRFLAVTNGADPELSRPMDKIMCREKLGFDPEGKFLIFVGSLKKWHGIEKIVEIMPNLLKKIPRLYLLIVGDGENKSAIENKVRILNLENKVILTGSVSFNDVPYYINAADICLAPYFEPGLDETGISPLKIYEYLACGRPVITNPVGGLEDLFDRHEAGILVHSLSPDDWIEPIVNLINDPARMDLYGTNGRLAVLNNFSWEAVCKKIENSLHSLLSAK